MYQSSKEAKSLLSNYIYCELYGLLNKLDVTYERMRYLGQVDSLLLPESKSTLVCVFDNCIQGNTYISGTTFSQGFQATSYLFASKIHRQVLLLAFLQRGSGRGALEVFFCFKHFHFCNQKSLVQQGRSIMGPLWSNH